MSARDVWEETDRGLAPAGTSRPTSSREGCRPGPAIAALLAGAIATFLAPVVMAHGARPAPSARSTLPGQDRPSGQQRPAARPDRRLQEVRALMAEGRLEEARQLLDEMLSADPDDSEVRLLAGRAALGVGDLAAAGRHLNAARDLDPRFPHVVHHDLGMLRLAEADPDGARHQLGLALEAAPGFAPARLARARVALLQGDVAAAREDLDAVAAGAPGPARAEAVVLLGELDLLAGRGSEAVARFRSVAGEPGSEEGPLPARMYLSTLAGSPEQSEPRIRAWLGQHLDDPHAWFWLGLVVAARGDREAARHHLSVALAIDDRHAPSWLAGRDIAPPGEALAAPPPYPGLAFETARARRALAEGDPGPATSTAEAIVATRPRFVPARLLLVEVAEARGDLLGALVHMDELLEVTGDLTPLLVHRATLARRVGALELAEGSARAALEQRPEDGSLHFLLGSILADAGRADEAIAALERALERGHRTADLYVTLGNLHHERQEIAAAVDAMQAAVELDPDTAGRIAGFALTAMTAEETEAVRRILEDHLERRPDDVEALYTLGSLQLRRGELEAARETFTDLSELAPDRARAHYNLALAHRRLGDEAAAEREMQRFRRLQRAEQALWEAHDRAYRLRQEADDALAAGEPDRALGLLEELLAGEAAEPRDRLRLGRALLRRADAERALRELRRALEALPHDAGALCATAEAAEAVGDAGIDVGDLRRRARLLLGHPCPEEPGAYRESDA